MEQASACNRGFSPGLEFLHFDSPARNGGDLTWAAGLPAPFYQKHRPPSVPLADPPHSESPHEPLPRSRGIWCYASPPLPLTRSIASVVQRTAGIRLEIPSRAIRFPQPGHDRMNVSGSNMSSEQVPTAEQADFLNPVQHDRCLMAVELERGLLHPLASVLGQARAGIPIPPAVTSTSAIYKTARIAGQMGSVAIECKQVGDQVEQASSRRTGA